MTDTVASVTAANSASAVRTIAAKPDTAAAISGSVAAANSSTTVTSSSGAVVPVLSPRATLDPVAGLITQYLNGQGSVELQFPSTAAVAYIHAGLTASGEPKSSTANGVLA